MNLIRLIAITLIIYLLYQMVKRWSANKTNSATRRENKKEIEHRMVRCTVCQLHIPEDEALEKEGEYFCTHDHYLQKQQNH